MSERFLKKEFDKPIFRVRVPPMNHKSIALTYDQAWLNVGGLSKPSKMPCYGWSISAFDCHVGSKLATVDNTVCKGCYALKGNYRFPMVQRALNRRKEKFYHADFTPSMLFLLAAVDARYFRWFDSGDLQDKAMLAKIVQIAKLAPQVKFWLPTKEYGIVQGYLKDGHAFPDNLNVRLSGYILDQAGPDALAKRLGVTTSEVRREGYTCPASKQGNFCGSCRECWHKTTFTVVYKKH